MNFDSAKSLDKAALDMLDDGKGPHDDWFLRCAEGEEEARKQAWADFQAWAKDHMGQGYSLACQDGWFLDRVTSWTYRGFLAGRGLRS